MNDDATFCMHINVYMCLDTDDGCKVRIEAMGHGFKPWTPVDDD